MNSNSSFLGQSVGTIVAVGYYLRNKFLSLILTAALIHIYLVLPDNTPLIEALYAAIWIMLVIISGPITRLLVFGEAAEYAEAGALDEDLARDRQSQRMIHYRWATAISYAIPLIVFATVTK